MASKDANFKERYEDNEKSLDECMKYITEQARKQAVNNTACISNDEVYGWAVHYYQEKDIKPTKTEIKAKVVVPQKKEEENKPSAKVVELKKKVSIKKKEAKSGKAHKQRVELDLFGEL